jgi:hypothetical protein
MTPSHPTWKAFLLMAGTATLLLLISALNVVGGR